MSNVRSMRDARDRRHTKRQVLDPAAVDQALALGEFEERRRKFVKAALAAARKAEGLS